MLRRVEFAKMPPMPARLLFRDAQGRDGAVDLRTEPVYIGRAVECAVRTDDAMVSRRHSLLTWVDGHYWIEDLGSSNGTHVNDVRVQRQALHHNDVVRCGSLWLRYVEQAAQPVSAPPAPTPPPAAIASPPAMQAAGGTPFAPTPFVPSVPTPSSPMAGPALAASPAGASPIVMQPVRTVSLRPGGPIDASRTSNDFEPTSAGQALEEDAMALRHELISSRQALAEMHAARDAAVAENRRVKDDLGRRLQALTADLDRVREELLQLARELGVKPRG